MNGSMGLGIAKASQHPEQAWQYIHYLTSQPVQDKYAKLSLPVWKSSYQDPAVAKGQESLIAVADKSLNVMLSRPETADYSRLSTPYNSSFRPFCRARPPRMPRCKPSTKRGAPALRTFDAEFATTRAASGMGASGTHADRDVSADGRPLARTLWLSFTDTALVGNGDVTNYLWLDNYLYALTDPDFAPPSPARSTSPWSLSPLKGLSACWWRCCSISHLSDAISCGCWSFCHGAADYR